MHILFIQQSLSISFYILNTVLSPYYASIKREIAKRVTLYLLGTFRLMWKTKTGISIIQYFEEELANLTEISDWERGGNKCIFSIQHISHSAWHTVGT